MSTDTTTTAPPANQTMTVAKPEKLVVHDSGPAAYLFDTARFEHCYRIATAMAKASLIPEHLTMTGSGANKKELPFEMIVGNCFMIVNQAIRWGMDPFALPAETYVVGNKLGFQGKLVAAVINARANLHAPLSVIYTGGRGDDLAAVVFGSRQPIPKEAWPLLKAYAKNEDGEAYTDLMAMDVLCIRISVGQAKTSNQMWTKDPQQKLFYSGATKWSRRHAPEIILGVLTDDDVERMNAASTNGTQVTRIDNIDQLTDRLTGHRPAMTHVVDGEATEMGNEETGDSTAEEVATEPATFSLEGAQSGFSACTSLTGIGKLESECDGLAKSDADKSAIAGMAEAARERIQSSRGPRSNGGKQKELAGAQS